MKINKLDTDSRNKTKQQHPIKAKNNQSGINKGKRNSDSK